MKRILGWILTIAGGTYLALLGAQGIAWLVSHQSINVYIPLLIASFIVCGIGMHLKEKKDEKKPV